MIEVSRLVKTYGSGATAVRALGGVDMSIDDGEFVAIMGPSGSGKSTLLHILGALEAPSEGDVSVGGIAYRGLDDAGLTRVRREHIGFVFQFFNLLPSLTAVENILLPALISFRHDDALTRRALELLERVGLGARAEHRPSEMSGVPPGTSPATSPSPARAEDAAHARRHAADGSSAACWSRHWPSG